MGKKIIAVSGTHGTGKTFLLEALKHIDECIVDDFKVSRSIQGSANLDNFTKTENSIIEFQEKIFDAKVQHDGSLTGNVPILVERSFFDIVIYTEISLSRFKYLKPTTRQWFKEYRARAFKAQADIYDGHIIIHPHIDIPFVQDPNRATFDTRYMFCEKMFDCSLRGKSLKRSTDHQYQFRELNLYCADINDRITEVKKFLQYL